ncbi:hypothetical protein [Aurantivibrio plasticivorans]
MSYFAATTQPRVVAFFVFFIVTGSSLAALLFGGWLNASHSIQFLGITLNALFGLFAVGIVLYTPFALQISTAQLFIFAIALRVLSLCLYPLLEDDYFRYLWDGFQTHISGSPYSKAPFDFFPGDGLSQRWQDILSGINNPDLKTIYGPVLQYLFLLSYWISPGDLAPLQVLLAIWDVLILAVLTQQKTRKSFLLAYAIHPMILQEAIASAHPDILLGGLLLFALLAWRSGRPFLTGTLLALACSSKISAIVAIPFLLIPASQNHLSLGQLSFMKRFRCTWQWSVKLVIAFIVALLALYAPLVSVGQSELESLFVFGQDWRFNPLLYRVLELVISQSGSADITRFFCATLLVSLALFLFSHQWMARFNYDTPPILIILIALLLLSPVVNPWYWLWVLPIATFLERRLLVLVLPIATASYWNTNTLQEIGWIEYSAPSFVVPWAITLFQVSIFALALVVEWQLTHYR